MNSSVQVYEGNYNLYPIPSHLSDTKFTKRGFADKRYKTYKPFMRWIWSMEEVDKKIVAEYMKMHGVLTEVV